MSTELTTTTPSPIERLLELAVDKNLGVEALEKLVGLHERVLDRQAAQEFSEAMALFQSKCQPIKKSSKATITTRGGAQYGYSYAELDEIARTIRPLIEECGLSYTWDMTETAGCLSCVCTLRHRSGHKVSATFACPVDSSAAMSGAQKHGAALTYARRQSLVQVLGLTTTDEDSDGADTTPISDDQAATIEDYLDGGEVDRVKFMGWLATTLRVDAVSAIRAADYGVVINALKAKVRG